MRKTDKKIDKAIRQALTEVCEIAQEHYDGFQWLTHFVNYHKFPSSLSVVCIYNRNEELENTDVQGLLSLINEKLAATDIILKNINRHVTFDTEENCFNENSGHWNERFKNQRLLLH